MKIRTALILCAGYGKRLNPLTLTTPKPLLRFNRLSMLEHTINFIQELGVKKIKLVLLTTVALNYNNQL